MKPFKLATGLIDGKVTPLVLVDGRAHELRSVLGGNAPADLLELFVGWSRFETELAAAVESVSGEGIDPASIAFQTPIAAPPKVICIGINYRDHLEEMKVAKLPDFPYAFLRPHTSLAAHSETIDLPSGAQMIDWEAELGVVIGARIGPGDDRDPLACVAGYTVVNDLSARDWIANRPMVGIDWVMQKAWDRFQPTGPWITPARFVPDPQKLAIKLSVNGVVKQDSNTASMLFGVREIVRHLASIMTLEPGDLIATGTPAGVGFGRTPPEFIKAGDHVIVEIEGLGRLETAFA